MSEKKLGRREFLKLVFGAAAGTVLVACAPKVEERIVKETVVVEKPVEKVVKETVVVEKPVEKVVEKVVTATPAPRTEVRIWGMPAPRYVENIARYIPKFEEEHPNIKIKFEPFPDDGHTKFMTQAVAGNAPDIILNGGDNYWKYVRNDLALDLKPYLSDLPRAYFEDWPKAFLEWLTAKDGSGSIWALPYRSWHMVLLYNKDLFDEVGVAYPVDWDHDAYLTEGLKFLKKDESGKLVRWGGHSIVKATMWLDNKLRVFGGSVADPKDWTRCALGDDEAQEALEWIYKCIWEENVWPRTEQMENYWFAPFDSAGIATQEAGSWIIGVWYPAIQDRFKWDFAPYPKGPAGRASIASSDCYTPWKETPHPDETWEVLKWMVSDDMEICMMEAQGSEPGRRSLYGEWYRIVKEQFPLMEDANWEVFERPVREGYDFYQSVFVDPGIANETLNPALELFIDVGEVKPDYFKQVAKDITEALKAQYG